MKICLISNVIILKKKLPYCTFIANVKLNQDVCTDEKRNGTTVKSDSNESLDSIRPPTSEYEPSQLNNNYNLGRSANLSRLLLANNNDNSNDYLHVEGFHRSRLISMTSSTGFLYNSQQQNEANIAIKRKVNLFYLSQVRNKVLVGPRAIFMFETVKVLRKYCYLMFRRPPFLNFDFILNLPRPLFPCRPWTLCLVCLMVNSHSLV